MTLNYYWGKLIMKLINSNELCCCRLFYKFGSRWSNYLAKYRLRGKVDLASTLKLQHCTKNEVFH